MTANNLSINDFIKLTHAFFDEADTKSVNGYTLEQIVKLADEDGLQKALDSLSKEPYLVRELFCNGISEIVFENIDFIKCEEWIIERARKLALEELEITINDKELHEEEFSVEFENQLSYFSIEGGSDGL